MELVQTTSDTLLDGHLGHGAGRIADGAFTCISVTTLRSRRVRVTMHAYQIHSVLSLAS